MNFNVRIAFLSGLAKSYLGCSFDYPLGVLIPFKVIAKTSRTSGILNNFRAQEMLTMKTSYISQVLLLELKFVSYDRSM